MEKRDLLQTLKAKLPQLEFETRPFGRDKAVSVWIEMRSLLTVARALRIDLGMDWLENLTAMEMEETLVLSYFLRSYSTQEFLIVRGTLTPKSPTSPVSADSVVSLWPTAQLFEREIQDLFGVEFSGQGDIAAVASILPPDWEGYPLRKGYQFPKMVMNMPHQRSVGKKEYS